MTRPSTSTYCVTAGRDIGTALTCCPGISSCPSRLRTLPMELSPAAFHPGMMCGGGTRSFGRLCLCSCWQNPDPASLAPSDISLISRHRACVQILWSCAYHLGGGWPSGFATPGCCCCVSCRHPAPWQATAASETDTDAFCGMQDPRSDRRLLLIPARRYCRRCTRASRSGSGCSSMPLGRQPEKRRKPSSAASQICSYRCC